MAVLDSVEFFKLPKVVQWKILEYIPVLTKIYTLSQIPKFSKLLEYRSSWLNTSKEFAELIPILHSLQEGLYVISHDFPSHGYYVWRETTGNKITFTLFFLNCNTSVDFPRNMKNYSISVDVSNFCDFLKYFLKHYSLLEKKSILVYPVNKFEQILINSSTNTVMWISGNIYPIKNNKCIINKENLPIFFLQKKNRIIALDYCKGIYFYLKKNNKISLYVLNKLNSRTLKKKYILEPETLQSYILNSGDIVYEFDNFHSNNWKRGPLPNFKKICLFEISLEGKEKVIVNVETTNTHNFWHYTKDLFNTLSQSIVKTIFEWNKRY